MAVIAGTLAGLVVVLVAFELRTLRGRSVGRAQQLASIAWAPGRRPLEQSGQRSRQRPCHQADRAVAATPGRRVAGAVAVALLVGTPVLASVGVGAALLLGAGAGALAGCHPILRARSADRRREARVADELPEVVDLFRMASGAGLNVRLAIDCVVDHGRGAIAERLRLVSQRVARGDRLADSLDELADLGEPVRPLLDAMRSADRHGTPMSPALDRVADNSRRLRRHRHEEAARRVPVKLLFPLVFCTLPALGLLTIVPVIVRSWPSMT